MEEKDTLEPVKSGVAGLCIPGKEGAVFRPSERKSILGLDVLANAKHGGSKVDDGLKVPKEVTSVVSSIDEEEKSEFSRLDEEESDMVNGAHNMNWRSCETAASENSNPESAVYGAKRETFTPKKRCSSDSIHSESSRVNLWFDGGNHRCERRDSKDDGIEIRRSRQTDSMDCEDIANGREVLDQYHHSHDGDYGKRRSRYDGMGRTPGRCEGDDGRWQWQDTPRRDGYSSSRGLHQPSPSPMFSGASPDARLVSPWTGGYAASPWDQVYPSYVPICASGDSLKSSSSRYSGRSNQLIFSAGKSESTEDRENDSTDLADENKYEISESMRLEMEYDADRAWYDREEGSTMFDGDSLSVFLGDEASFQKKEADLAKRLVRRDGTKMTLAQSRKRSLLTADDAQWEGRQLLRSGAVRGTEVQTEFDEEEECKVLLLVHDTKPPFLDGRVVFTKQAEPIMPLKDPTSDMAIISRKGSALVREIHEKQSMNKSRQRFWELAGSKLGDILGVEKSEAEIDADTAVVGEQGKVDFKEEAKFAQHMKKGIAVSEFAVSKTMIQQRQFLPIYSVRDELLQVIREKVQEAIKQKECFNCLHKCPNEENLQNFRLARKNAKKAVREARGKAFSDMYKKLGSKEGEKDIYRLAKIRDKKSKDSIQIRCIKDENQKLLVRDEEVKERWVSYFNKLYNGEGDRSDVDLVDVSNELNRRFVCRIGAQEVKDALKKMKTSEALGPDGVPIEVWRCLGNVAISWLIKLFNKILQANRMPDELRKSMIVPIYKNMGDIQNCCNYRGIKLMSHTMKLWERVIEHRLRIVTKGSL